MSTNEDITPNIAKLELSDDFYALFLATNKLIDYVNPIQLYDITLGPAFSETRGSGVISINLNVGNGLKLFTSVGSGNLSLDLESIYSANEVVLNNDYILIERPTPASCWPRARAANPRPTTSASNTCRCPCPPTARCCCATITCRWIPTCAGG